MKSAVLLAFVFFGCSSSPAIDDPPAAARPADLLTIEPGQTWTFGDYELRAVADTMIASRRYVRVTSDGALGLQGTWYLGHRENAAEAIQYGGGEMYRRISLYPEGLTGQAEYRISPYGGIPLTGAARATVLGWVDERFGFRISTHRLITDTAWDDADEWWFAPSEGLVEWRSSTAGGWEIHTRTP
jgi:hypothetical protein